jgi:hypothetical protein
VHHAKLRHGKAGSALAFFYCNSSEKRTLTALTILGSFIEQLGSQFGKLSKPMPVLLGEKVKQARNERRSFFDEDELIEILFSFAANSLETFFILDGLDECVPGEREKVLSFFGRLSQRKVAGSIYRILISSRVDVDVSREIPSCIRLPILATNLEGDIYEYVHNVVDDLIEKEKLKVRDDSLVVDIKKKLSHGAQGMYVC